MNLLRIVPRSANMIQLHILRGETVNGRLYFKPVLFSKCTLDDNNNNNCNYYKKGETK